MTLERVKRLGAQCGVCLLVTALLCTLVPLLLLGQYARPAADDFCYGILPHNALVNGQPLYSAVWNTIVRYYFGWQGSFSAVALMSLTPCIYGEPLYGITTVVMLLTLCLGTLKLTDTLVRRKLGGTRGQVICVGAPVLLLTIQALPGPLQAFFWWNGAVYYTFTYGVMLLFFDRLLSLQLAQHWWEILLSVFPGLATALFLGGSNYVSALISILVAGLFLLYFLIQTSCKFFPALIMTLLLTVGFLVSVFSPGNAVRQADQIPMPPLEAVLASILQAWEDVQFFLTAPVLILLLLLVPLLWKLTAHINFRFPLPVLFTVMSFLLFAAHNAPHFYAMTTAGPTRLRNIVYYAFYWLTLANEWYYLGWLRRLVAPHRIGIGKAPTLAVWVGRAVQWGIVLLLSMSFPAYLPHYTTVEALAELNSGQAQRYASAWDARLTVLRDPTQRNPVFSPLPVQPLLLYYMDISEDSTLWTNGGVSNYYDKESVLFLDH